MWNNKENSHMTFLYVQALCPFLSSLRLFPLQFPFVSKALRKLSFVCQMLVCDGRWEGEKGRNFGVAGLLCHLHETQSHKVNCFLSFHILSFTACDWGSTFSSACVGFILKTLKVFLSSRLFLEMIWGKGYFFWFFFLSSFSYEVWKRFSDEISKWKIFDENNSFEWFWSWLKLDFLKKKKFKNETKKIKKVDFVST